MTPLPREFLTAPLAHRGFHNRSPGCPENSIAAFQAAIENGYGIELDVQMTGDNQAIVFHDYDLDRLTGEHGFVQQRTTADLCNLNILNGNEKIRTLVEVLEFVAGRAAVLIEIKDQDGALGPNVGALEKCVAEATKNYRGPVAAMSFNPYTTAALADYAPDTPRGLATGTFTSKKWDQLPEKTRIRLREIPDLKSTQSSFISHEFTDLERPVVQDIRASGLPVLCWTLTDQNAENTARKHADNITFEGYQPRINHA